MVIEQYRAVLKITLTLDEDQTLKELELENKVPRRTRNRASILRINSRGWTVKEIAEYLGWAKSTVRQTFTVGINRDYQGYGMLLGEETKPDGLMRIGKF